MLSFVYQQETVSQADHDEGKEPSRNRCTSHGFEYKGMWFEAESLTRVRFRFRFRFRKVRNSDA